MEKALSKNKKPLLSNTFFFAVTSALSISLLFMERSDTQLLVLLFSFLSAGFLLKRKTLYIFIAAILIVSLLGIREIAENEDVSIKIMKKLFLIPSGEADDTD